MDFHCLLTLLLVAICAACALGHDFVPSVLVSILVRNKAHYLPYFLHHLENLDYPKKKMALWIRGDHNEDGSMDIVHQWLRYVKDQYLDVDVEETLQGESYPGELGPAHWTSDRMQRVTGLREESLRTARKKLYDYMFAVDCDNILLNEWVLWDLIAENRTVVAPMINATVQPDDNNFWGKINNKGEKAIADNHISILDREIKGCFRVDLVHSTVLINLKHAKSYLLSYEPPQSYSWELTDNLIFTYNTREHEIPLHILNKGFYGFMPNAMDDDATLEMEVEQSVYLVTESLTDDHAWERLPYIETDDRVDNMGFDKIYVINLKRRPDKKQTMQRILNALHIDGTFIEAVDGRELTNEDLTKQSITMLPGYQDVNFKRPMTMGEVGCFLSHYKIWQEVIQNNYRQVIVLEDDGRFAPYFNLEVRHRMEEVKSLNVTWDLIYLGRLIEDNRGGWIANSDETLVWPDFSYTTIAYALSITGARKLVEQQPLSKLLPVDEYIPIMYDQHYRSEWKEKFSPRDLVALAVNPNLVQPKSYLYDEGYTSDTEDTPLIKEDVPPMKKHEL